MPFPLLHPPTNTPPNRPRQASYEELKLEWNHPVTSNLGGILDPRFPLTSSCVVLLQDHDRTDPNVASGRLSSPVRGAELTIDASYPVTRWVLVTQTARQLVLRGLRRRWDR